MTSPSIAMLAHSTNARGGVVHAMELCHALHELGHEITLHAPDPTGAGFFRKSIYEQVPFAVGAAPVGLYDMVQQRIADYVHYFTSSTDKRFDVYHAHDGISGNAMETLAQRGLIPSYVRTVHHMDEFSDPRLNRLQLRSILHAKRVFCVSRIWQLDLAQKYGVAAELVPTGVDHARFSPHVATADAELRSSLGIHTNSRVFLSIGGIEPRKNTLNILRAFEEIHREIPCSQLIIAGGATLLDHTEYVDAFWQSAKSSHLNFGNGKDVVIASEIADGSMPSLYRIADALVFPSVKEGFGLVVLEALASGIPVILSRIAPFTEYMPEDGCLWSGPHDVASIAYAMRKVLQPETRECLRRRSQHIAEAFSWTKSAQVHAEHYRQVLSATLNPEFRDTETSFAGAAHA